VRTVVYLPAGALDAVRGSYAGIRDIACHKFA
jgi:hypothetical protein